VQEELNHQFGSDSVFWISYEDLLRKYQHFDRTRLFRDPDWRCCQRWIGVDVPWKPQYHEKFHIKLTRESPLVLVLSQLDNRYFKGLHGQYSFRLQFRLHEQDRPDPEDYIVRSHGNYLMDRSVSIELPAMLPGNYSVFISVVGERDPDLPSVEDVVKRECKKRVENEKLAQVGYAYDLAHSKAAAHLEAVRRLRKKADQKKASSARVKERHRLWEKRHLNRQITKKQGRKNNQKLEAKQAAREEKKRQAEELKPKDQGVQTEDIPKPEDKKVSQQDPDTKEEAKDGKASEDPSKTEDKKAVDEKAQGEEAKDSPDTQKDKSSETTESKKPEDYESPDATPIPTPAETPTLERSGQLTPDKSDGKTDETLDTRKDGQPEKKSDQTTDDKSEEKAGGQSDDKKTDKAEDKTEDKTKGKAEDAQGKDSGPPSSGASDSSGSPTFTPKSDASSVPSTDVKDQEKVPVPPVDASKVSGSPPPPPAPSTKTTSGTTSGTSGTRQGNGQNQSSKRAPNMYVTSDGESSASPIEDWEELYSSDDMSRKPRMAAPPPPGTTMVSKYRDDTEDENEPDPWNAICVVGLRVYSKDEDLELRVVMEGGELEEDGMGEKGGVDLDNAQANAGGARSSRVEKKEDEDAYEGDSEIEKKTKRGGKKKDGEKSDAESEKEKEKETDENLAPYPVIVQKGKGDEEYETAVESLMD
jgi:hypothetical protein